MDHPKPWHHRPAHLFVPGTAYILTCGTLHKRHLFRGEERLRILRKELFDACATFEWTLQAWALFSNHYHIIALSPADAGSLKTMLQRLHSATSRAVNRLDAVRGRQCWFQYWDTCLTYESSYFARLNYVNTNPVRHGLVPDAELYEFCSASWFAANADRAFWKRVRSYKCDDVAVDDEYRPVGLGRTEEGTKEETKAETEAAGEQIEGDASG